MTDQFFASVWDIIRKLGVNQRLRKIGCSLSDKLISWPKSRTHVYANFKRIHRKSYLDFMAQKCFICRAKIIFEYLRCCATACSVQTKPAQPNAEYAGLVGK